MRTKCNEDNDKVGGEDVDVKMIDTDIIRITANKMKKISAMIKTMKTIVTVTNMIMNSH
jgi:hypothetical protein